MKRKSGKDILIERLLLTFERYCCLARNFGIKTTKIIFNNSEYIVLSTDYLILCKIIDCIKESSFIEFTKEDFLYDKRRT